MSVNRIDYNELLNDDLEYVCPRCGEYLYRYPEYLDAPAFLTCIECNDYWVDTVQMLRWLKELNQGQKCLFVGSEPNELPKDNFGLMLGGDNPDSGRHLSVDKLFQYLADMMEE